MSTGGEILLFTGQEILVFTITKSKGSLNWQEILEFIIDFKFCCPRQHKIHVFPGIRFLCSYLEIFWSSTIGSQIHIIT